MEEEEDGRAPTTAGKKAAMDERNSAVVFGQWQRERVSRSALAGLALPAKFGGVSQGTMTIKRSERRHFVFLHPVSDLGQSCTRTKEAGRTTEAILAFVLAIHSPFLSIPGVVRESIMKGRKKEAHV